MKVSKITIVEDKVFLFSTTECEEVNIDSFKEHVRAYLDESYSNSGYSFYIHREDMVTSVLVILNINEHSSSEELEI